MPTPFWSVSDSCLVKAKAACVGPFLRPAFVDLATMERLLQLANGFGPKYSWLPLQGTKQHQHRPVRSKALSRGALPLIFATV